MTVGEFSYSLFLWNFVSRWNFVVFLITLIPFYTIYILYKIG